MTALQESDPSVEEVVDGCHGRVVQLAGGNFSGRSALITACAKFLREHGHLAVVLPPDLPVSGLTATVADELALHLGPRSSSSDHWELAQEWGLIALGSRRLHHLSGGQLAMLVILCKLALKPRFLGLDGTLEQLDPANVRRVVTALSAKELLPGDAVVLIAHNGVLPEFLPSLHCASESLKLNRTPVLHADRLMHRPLEQPVDVTIQNASFGYTHGPPVFRGLNLHLRGGRIYRLAGPNGSGKSTLALILLGHLRLRFGEILVDGTLHELFKRPGSLASYHFQRPDDQLFESSVRREIDMLPPASREPAVGFGSFEPELDRHPFDLPFVLRKRLALGVVLPLQTPWLIVDEPTLGQDMANRAELGKALKAIAATGRGILLITHDDAFAKDTIDETINLSNAHASADQ